MSKINDFFLKMKNFLIDVKTELKKSTWPTWQELSGATGVVAVSIILVAIFIFFADTIMQWLMYSDYGFRGLCTDGFNTWLAKIKSKLF